MASWTLTIRDGPKVTRDKHRSLDDGLEALRDNCERIRSDGGLPEVSMLRTYESGDRVKARLELSTGWALRGRDAGIDVMGDGALIPFRGGIARRPLEPRDGASAYELVAEALSAPEASR